jgi:hypothetical protein
LSISLQYAPIRQEWHDLESFVWLLVWIVLRHSPHGSLIQNGTYDLSHPEQRERALKQVFPLHNLGDGDEAIKNMSTSKLQFLTDAMLLIPEAREIQTLIRILTTKFCDLYRFLKAAEAMEHRKSLMPLVGGSNKALTASDLYSFSSMEALQKYFDKTSGEARSFKENHRLGPRENAGINDDFAAYEKAFRNLESAMRILQEEGFPHYDEVHAEFTSAIESAKGSIPSMPSFDFQNRFPPSFMSQPLLHKRNQSLALKSSHSQRFNLTSRLQHSDGDAGASVGPATRERGRMDGKNVAEVEEEQEQLETLQ